MYFFRAIILITMIVFIGFTLYFISRKKFINRSNFFMMLGLIQGLMIIFNTSFVYFMFLDFSCFLGYLLNRNREALILSLVNVLYYLLVLDVSVYYFLVYFVYFGISRLVKDRERVFSYLLTVKAFLTSFVYFFYYSNSGFGIELIYLVFVLLYFYLVLEISYRVMKGEKQLGREENLLFQVAHEVKNPIAVCKGYLDMLDTNKKDKVDKYIPIIRSEMNRALTIMDDFLNLKRLTINQDIMDLSLLIEDIEKTMLPILGNDKVKLEVPDLDELFIIGDYGRLKQVLVNLIKNAKEAGAKRIRIVIEEGNKEIRVSIVDDGVGMDNKTLRKIGDLFYTTKVKGTGIGVHLAKEIVKLHHGSIKYDSTLGEGTTVLLTLPNNYI